MDNLLLHTPCSNIVFVRNISLEKVGDREMSKNKKWSGRRFIDHSFDIWHLQLELSLHKKNISFYGKNFFLVKLTFFDLVNWHLRMIRMSNVHFCCKRLISAMNSWFASSANLAFLTLWNQVFEIKHLDLNLHTPASVRYDQKFYHIDPLSLLFT